MAIDNQRQEMTWRNMERSIARLNRDHRSSLKAKGTWRIINHRRII